MLAFLRLREFFIKQSFCVLRRRDYFLLDAKLRIYEYRSAVMKANHGRDAKRSYPL